MKKLILPTLCILLLLACRKDSFTDSPDAYLSTIDSLHFDTVFTSTGSVSQIFKIVNENEDGIRVNSVRLAGGATSPFKINVDGRPGPVVNNVEIKANDSIYVFVTVTIDPNATNLAFLVQDSIEITYNGNSQWVQLDAFGQNAHFFRNRIITGTETWNNDLPYVILGGLVVDTNAVLNINKGSRIHLHADAPFIVHGTLNVNGEKWDSTRVIFTGDRLDEPYRNFPASYPGLIFTDVSKDNVLQYAIIKNAFQGIIVDQPSPNLSPKLTLNEVIIDNAYDAGIIGINTSIDARNLLVSNCGKNIQLVSGGKYNFIHTTAASYSNSYIQHREPVLSVANHIPNSPIPPNPLDANFTNCIFWGENTGLVTNEILLSKQGSSAFNVNFDHVLWRVESNPPLASSITNAINSDPLFDSVNAASRYYDFRLKEESPALNSGKTTSVTLDLDGNPRPVAQPDRGSYEKQ